MKKIVVAIILFLWGLWGMNMYGQAGYSLDAIQDSLVRQLFYYPQEKIHLHIDRSMYVPDERIWFKAYITDAFSLEPLTKSMYIYVELIDSTHTIRKRVMVRQGEDLMYYGHLLIPEEISDGVYTVRAYTRYMENLGADYFFRKNIQIRDIASEKEAERGGSGGSRKDDYHVSLLPEGGNLLAGTFCKVAFKAQNVNGYSENITGEVVNEKGEQIATVKTIYAGMGVFSFIPEKGKRYFLRCKNMYGREKRFELPAVASTYGVFTTSRNSSHLVTIGKSGDCPEKSLYLLILTHGKALYFDIWDNQKKTLSIPCESLPSGVIRFLLFDEDMNPLSERLVFNKSNDQAEAIFETEKSVYGRREKVIAGLSMMDSQGAILSGNLSVAITDENDVETDTMTTILSSLLLSSELKGYIANPAYYLQDTPESESALDLLMMTHGWRRYNVAEVIKGNYEYPKIDFEQSKGIAGKVTTRLFRSPVEGSNVTFVTNDGTYGVLVSDSAGRFSIYGLDYPDSTRIILQAKNTKGTNFVNLEVENEKFPKPLFVPNSPSSTTPEIATVAFLQKADQRAKYDEDMMLIKLDEVTVKAKRKSSDRVLDYYLNVKPDYVINREAITQFEQRNVDQLILMLPGVTGHFFKGELRFSVTKRGGARPVVIIDGIQQNLFMGFSPFDNIKSVDDIKEIFVLKGGQTARFGLGLDARFKRFLSDDLEGWGIIGPSRIGGIDYFGDTGAIIINTFEGNSGYFTRRRHFNNVSLRPLGYQTPVAFYSPKYETPEEKNFSVPDYRTTIFWKPDIVVHKGGKAYFEFYTSDVPTTYSVVIEGISSEGKIVHKKTKIEVK